MFAAAGVAAGAGAGAGAGVGAGAGAGAGAVTGALPFSVGVTAAVAIVDHLIVVSVFESESLILCFPKRENKPKALCFDR